MSKDEQIEMGGKVIETLPNTMSNATGQKNTYISHFLLKSLHNKWTIEKKQHNYILSKKHRGKKEYFSPNFLTCFMENSF